MNAQYPRYQSRSQLETHTFWFTPFDEYLRHRCASSFHPHLQKIQFEAVDYKNALRKARDYAIRNSYALVIIEEVEKQG